MKRDDASIRCANPRDRAGAGQQAFEWRAQIVDRLHVAGVQQRFACASGAGSSVALAAEAVNSASASAPTERDASHGPLAASTQTPKTAKK